jgi:glucokinase
LDTERRQVDPAAAIATAALEKRDSLSEQTMQLFVEAYGAEAGNLALKLLPYNGLYVAGGIRRQKSSVASVRKFLTCFHRQRSDEFST